MHFPKSFPKLISKSPKILYFLKMTCKKVMGILSLKGFSYKNPWEHPPWKNPLSQMLRNFPLKMIFLKCMKLYFPSLIFHHHLEFSTEVHFLNQKNKIMRNYLSKYHFKHSSDFHKIFLLPKIKQTLKIHFPKYVFEQIFFKNDFKRVKIVHSSN